MISVITPLRNDKRFIEECIKNIIDQKCVHLEHIIVDGGSTDGSLAVVKEYADKHPHIRWISASLNQSAAMNVGISMARFPIIGILNSDDFYEPNTLKRIIEIFKNKTEPSIVIGNCTVWGEKNTIEEVNQPNVLDIQKMLQREMPFPCNPSAYFYHRSLHDQIGWHDEWDNHMMDIDFLCRALQKAHVKYHNEIWGNYRHIRGTKSREYQKNRMHVLHFKRICWRYGKGYGIAHICESVIHTITHMIPSWRGSLRFRLIQKYRDMLGITKPTKDMMFDFKVIPGLLFPQKPYTFLRFWKNYVYRKYLYCISTFSKKDRSQPVFILSTPRSGSNLLLSYLNSLPDTEFLGEIFNNQMSYGLSFIGQSKKKSLRHIKKMLSLTHKKTYGIKIQLPQLFRHRLTIDDLKKEFPYAKFIILYRTSLLDQFVSMVTASKTGRFLSNKKEEDIKISIQKPLLDNFCHRIKAWYTELHIQQYVPEYTWISYESLASNPQELFKYNLCPFLEIPYTSVHTNMVKQNTQPTFKRISNYRDIKEDLENDIYFQKYTNNIPRPKMGETKESLIIFVHIPKTGGETVKQIIKRQYHGDNIENISKKKISARRTPEYISQISKDFSKEKHVLMGHFLFGIHGILPKECTYITFLRDPIKRALSLYFFIKRNPIAKRHNEVCNIPLEEFLTTYVNGNDQTNWLSAQRGEKTDEPMLQKQERAKYNLRNHFAAIGLTERFDESLMCMEHIFGWKNIFPYQKRNVTRDRPHAADIDPKVIDLIREKSTYDIELYAYAQALFEEQLHSIDPLSLTLSRRERELADNSLTSSQKDASCALSCTSKSSFAYA